MRVTFMSVYVDSLKKARRPFPYISDWNSALGIDAIFPIVLRPRPTLLRLTRKVPAHLTGDDIMISDDEEMNQEQYYHPSYQNMALDQNQGISQYQGPLFNVPTVSSVGIGFMPSFVPPLSARKPKLASNLPNGTKLLQGIQVEDPLCMIRIMLDNDPMVHSINLDQEIRTLKFKIVRTDLTKILTKIATEGTIGDTSITVYVNSKQISSENDDIETFITPLMPGMNAFEILVTYKPPDTARLLRGHSTLPFETQDYLLFIMRH